MEQRSLIIILIAILLIGGAIGAGLFVKAPSASVTGVSVNSFNLSSISLAITLTVDSPYPISIPVRSLQYAVTYKGEGADIPLGKGEKTGIILKPGSQDLIIPMVVSNPSLVRSVLRVLTSGEILLTITGNLTPEFFGTAPTVPFSREMTIPVTGEDIISGLGSFAGKLLG